MMCSCCRRIQASGQAVEQVGVMTLKDTSGSNQLAGRNWKPGRYSQHSSLMLRGIFAQLILMVSGPTCHLMIMNRLQPQRLTIISIISETTHISNPMTRSISLLFHTRNPLPALKKQKSLGIIYSSAILTVLENNCIMLQKLD